MNKLHEERPDIGQVALLRPLLHKNIEGTVGSRDIREKTWTVLVVLNKRGIEDV